jgi:hypothetical protein
MPRLAEADASALCCADRSGCIVCGVADVERAGAI